MGSVNTNIAAATVAKASGVQGEPYECCPDEFHGNLKLKLSKLVTRGFLGSLNTIIVTATVSELPGVHGGSYDRCRLELYVNL